jgi:hypothetical protein
MSKKRNKAEKQRRCQIRGTKKRNKEDVKEDVKEEHKSVSATQQIEQYWLGVRQGQQGMQCNKDMCVHEHVSLKRILVMCPLSFGQ